MERKPSASHSLACVMEGIKKEVDPQAPKYVAQNEQKYQQQAAAEARIVSRIQRLQKG
jgi:hypothetical protein